MTILSGTPLVFEGLTLTPSTNLTLANNTIQRTSTPLAGNPSINRLYQFSTAVPFSGTVAVNYLPSELNGYSEYTLQVAYNSEANTPLTVTEGSAVNLTNHIVSNTLTDQSLLVVTATALSDLSPILYARPSTATGATPNFNVVVDVFELNSVATTGTFIVRISRDPKVTLSLPAGATSVGGRPVQNSAWTLSGPSGGFYTLTANRGVAAGDVLSAGLTGTLLPGATTGTLTVSTTVLPGTLVEADLGNNTDAEKVDYFQQ
ncbi:hypothetical protein GCM10028773_38430 [Spirosoma koreense]